jgi:hypothetical protein
VAVAAFNPPTKSAMTKALVAGVIFTLYFAWPAHVSAADWNACVVDGVATVACTEVVFENVLSIMLGILGIAAFVMIVVSGLQMLLAAGDPKRTEAAQKTLTYAIVGLVIIFIVWFALLFISQFTGVTNFLDFTFSSF